MLVSLPFLSLIKSLPLYGCFGQGRNSYWCFAIYSFSIMCLLPLLTFSRVKWMWEEQRVGDHVEEGGGKAYVQSIGKSLSWMQLASVLFAFQLDLISLFPRLSFCTVIWLPFLLHLTPFHHCFICCAEYCHQQYGVLETCWRVAAFIH